MQCHPPMALDIKICGLKTDDALTAALGVEVEFLA